MDQHGSSSPQLLTLLHRIRAGDRQALDTLLAEQRPLLKVYIARRLAAVLQRRVDASDVVQAVLIEVTRRIDGYLQSMPVPFELWLRKIAHEQLLMQQRKHLVAQKRSLRREVHFSDPSKFAALEMRLLAGAVVSPSQNVSQREATAFVRRIVESLPSADREVLQMRLVDDLPFAEIAAVLKMETATVRKRFGRAMAKLSVKLKSAGWSEG